jgi:glyoxylase-like metal-dependent hydrolase (beta-lactamase superfamily II)
MRPKATENPLSRRRFLQLAGAALVVQSSPKISTTDLGGGLTLFQGAGCNVIALRGKDGALMGALMIDGGLAVNADALVKAVKERTGSTRIHTLINTHWHPEQTGANEAAGRDGAVIFAHEKTKMYLSNTVTSVTFEGRQAPLPPAARPNKTTQVDGSLEFDGHKIDYGYLPAAHTDGDLYVHFPAMNVLVAGGPVSGEQWPLLDYRNGAWYGGRVRAHEKLGGLVRPDTRVVPAHGRPITGKELLRIRDIYKELFTTMIGYMNMGLGAEDVVERNPLKKYEAEFGNPSAFLNTAYRSMQIAYVPD